MANLIDQMNILKGLGDEHLAAEVNAPSGSAPPYLVLAELNRRKVMREKYAGEQARRKPQTTVAQDVTTSMPPQNGGMGLDAAPPMTGMGGVGSPTGLEAGAAPMPSYAEGGIVAYADGGGINYDDISQRYNARLEGLGGDKDQARALALITAGATIMGGKSSNALTNIGAGIGPAVQQYSDALKTTDSEELSLLRGITDIGQLKSSDANSALDFDLRRQALAQEKDLAEQRLATDKTPAAVLTTQWLMKQPKEVQQLYMDTQRAAAGVLTPDKAGLEFNAQEDVVRKRADMVPPTETTPAIRRLPAEQRPAALVAAQAEYEKKVKIETYKSIRNSLGPERAQVYAANSGLSADDTVAIDTEAATGSPGAFPAPDGTPTDPYGLGLGL